MITYDEKGEFTFTVLDLIKQLVHLDEFVLRIWTNNSELSFNIDDSYDIHFIQETIRYSKDNKVTYIALDSIVSIILLKDTTLEDVLL